MNERTLLVTGELRVAILELLASADVNADVVLGAPGLTDAFPGRTRIVTSPGHQLSIDLAAAYRSIVLRSFAGQVDALPQTRDNEDLIRLWMGMLETGDRRVLHFARRTLFSRLLSYPDRTLVSPAPIDSSTLQSEHELSFELSGEAHEDARAWFERLAAASDDISDEVLELLKASWAGALVDPVDLYCKTLIDYFWTIIEGMDQEGDANPMLGYLTEFQVKAYEYAKGVLRRYGGVFLADVVGLGKTFIGMALLRHLQDRYDEHAVVIAPPSVCPAWDELAREHRVNLVTVSIGKLDDLSLYEDREVLLIDESHNFRNRGTQRHGRIQQWLRPDGAPSWRKVILLSATPQNNDPVDVKHQLAFFPDNYARLPYRGESLDDWFASVRSRQADLADLLQHVVVRRTRRFITAAYPDAKLRLRTGRGLYEEVPLVFPRRISGEEQCLRYSIDRAYGGGLYRDILATLEAMDHALYGLALYVLPEYADDSRVQGVCRAGRSLRGLYKVLVLKRLESSVFAFRKTLERLQVRLQTALRRLEKGLVRVRQTVPVRLGIDTSDDLGIEPTIDREVDVPAELFDMRRLREGLGADLDRVSGLLARVSRLGADNDAKLARLRSWLSSRPPREHRTIVFTQFADTANYLGSAVAQAFGRTLVVTGSSGNALRAARRFAPRANRVDVAPDDQLDLLLSTDALSEGVNLQDADTMINYDLHWNPVRLIQRAGRIDRIGSTNDEIWIASFLPEAGLESRLGLEQVLRARSQEFIAVFGEDAAVLPTDELLNDEIAMRAYTGIALDEHDSDDELDGLSRHIERLHGFRKREPERYNRCLDMRAGRRSISASTLAPLTATRVAWYWRFWRQKAGELEAISDQLGLDELFRHAEAGAANLPETPWLNTVRDFVETARERFGPDAAEFREQRTHPRLRPVEQWVLDSLHRYRRDALASEVPFLKELEDWLREGHAKIQVARMGRVWRREKLPPATVVRELRPLYQRFPPVHEELPEAEVVFTALGDGSPEAGAPADEKTGGP